MAENNGTLKTKIVIPEEIIGRRLLDESGLGWLIERTWQTKFILFPHESAEFKNSGKAEISLRDAFMAECEKKLGPNFRKAAEILSRKFASQLSPIFNHCIEEAERDFRKAFVQNLGTIGRKVIHEVIQKSFADIGKTWNKSEEGPTVFSAWGPFPPQTKFRWQLQDKGAVYDMFLQEFPPHKQTIMAGDRMRYVAFPWLCIITAFKNGEIVLLDGSLHRAANTAFWCFYRPRPIKSEKDSLYFTNLPNVWSVWPHMSCLGSSLPVIKIGNPDWSNSLLTYFWQSVFSSDDSNFLSSKVKKQIPEIATNEKWEYLSKTNPDKMLALPWLALDEDIGTFAKHVLTYFAEGKNEEKNTKKISDQAREKITGDFGERLEEALYFLGSSFVLRPETEKVIKGILDEKIALLKKEVDDKLLASAESIARTAISIMFNNNKGGERVPSLD